MYGKNSRRWRNITKASFSTFLTLNTKEGVQLVLSFVFQFTTNRARQEIMGASVANEFVNRALTLFLILHEMTHKNIE